MHLHQTRFTLGKFVTYTKLPFSHVFTIFPFIDYEFSSHRDQCLSQGLTATDIWLSRPGGSLLQHSRQMISCPYQRSLVRLCNSFLFSSILKRDRSFLRKYIPKYIIRSCWFLGPNPKVMVIGSNERSWSVDVPFDHFGQKHPTGSGQIGQNSPK